MIAGVPQESCCIGDIVKPLSHGKGIGSYGTKKKEVWRRLF